jgi:hypothetical protein
MNLNEPDPDECECRAICQKPEWGAMTNKEMLLRGIPTGRKPSPKSTEAKP